MTRSELEHILETYFAPRSDIHAVYLFGSQATGRATQASDVDVAVLYAGRPNTLVDGPHADEAKLAEQLRHPVQVVAMNRAPADLVHRILRDGHLLVDNCPSRRIAFEVKSRNVYFDLAPIRKRYRRRAA